MRLICASTRGKREAVSTTNYYLEIMQITTLLNRIDDRPVDTALIQTKPIAMQWTEELRRIIGTHPSCKLLRELLNLDLYTRTVLYPFFIKGWSPRRIADRLKVPLITIQKLLETGREQLKGKLAAPR
jgi:DNA-directed RNA polymerase specialized sigma24 family protein